jgi:serine protein kinase
MKKYNGDWEKVLTKHIRVVRKVFSEADRCGIATFQPKDEKNQDATELTGDINYRQVSFFGSDSDSRAFNFDGEFCVGNRGMIEFIEALKLAQEFLYDLLGATQERQIKPKKFAQIMIDEAIIAHTNNPEYERLKNNQYMEALRDRTVKIDVPYLTEWNDEIKVLEQDYGKGKVRQHVAPHTLQIAALWNVLTRLEDDKEGKLDLVQKAKLYNGQMLPSYTEDSIKELRDKYPEEGMTRGVSARYTQDKISNCLSNNYEYINAFMVLNEIREGLEGSSLITKKDDVGRYHACIDLAVKEYDEIVKDEVRRALVGDEEAIVRLCTNYIDNLMAYIKKSRVKNPFTGREEPANERLMRSIEEKIEVGDNQVDDFRRMIAAFIGDCAHEHKEFRWDTNPELKKALESELFERTKDHIKLSALHISGAATVSPDLQQKIDAIKKRLIDQYGYNDKSATDVLDYVGSIFARGEASKDD